MTLLAVLLAEDKNSSMILRAVKSPGAQRLEVVGHNARTEFVFLRCAK